MPRVAVIGAGFAGMSAAAYLSSRGYEVSVFEKNSTAGGRARQLKTGNGYLFDMGPSWYWMPDIFEGFFSDHGFSAGDFYDLHLLEPSFEVVFGEEDSVCIPSDYVALRDLFESIEKGSARQLDRFMREAGEKYKAVISRLAAMPGLSIFEFVDPTLLRTALRYDVFGSFHAHVRKFFSNPALLSLLEFPILFLGATSRNTPAMYSIMNYAGLKLGTYYPMGGFGKVVKAVKTVAEFYGTRFHFNSTVESIEVQDSRARAIVVNGERIGFDAVVAAADYHHVETMLLPGHMANYNEEYWHSRVLAPSCLVYFIGLKKQLPSLLHHTLFFEEDFELHSREIYTDPSWPSRPLFYLSCTSRTDHRVAPPGHEALFFLMPIANGLEDSEEMREKYLHIMLSRLESRLGETGLADYIDYKQSYCVNDFIMDYNSFRGNAYGLANTLQQTAILKPKMRNRKIRNLFYAGQLTVPGPGVPPSLISGKLAAGQVEKFLKTNHHEIAF